MSSIKQTKRYWCAAEGCNSDDRKRGKYGFMSGVEFFPFPSAKHRKQRKRWLDLLRRENYQPTAKHRLCSLHFVDGRPTERHPYPELFAYNGFKRSECSRPTTSIIKRESSQVIPRNIVSDNDGTTCSIAINIISSTEADTQPSLLSTPHIMVSDCIAIDHEEIISVDNSVDVSFVCNAPVPEDHNYMYVLKHTTSESEPTFTEVGTQTDISMQDMKAASEDRLACLETEMEHKEELMRNLFINKVTESDKNVQQYLGVPSLLALFGIFGILDRVTPCLKYWRGQSGTHQNTGYQSGRKKKTGPQRKLTKFQEFIITLLKIRLGLFSFLLADIFGISVSRVSQIVATWLNFMYLVFNPLLKWPSTRLAKKFMPKCFKMTYPNTKCIIDCTEFFIDKPGSPTAQALTYSSYKHRNTLKALIGISPSGAITYVSNLWGGNVSDRYITEHSGFLELLQPGDEIMADRGFSIHDLCLERHAKLVIPPFTKKCKWGKGRCLSANDIKKTKNIARLRIHVERAIERLKNYRILSNTMSLKLKPLANQTLKVCAFLCNLQKPLVKK